MKAAVGRHMDKVARLGRCICQVLGWGETPPQLHHIREGQGMSQRAPDMLVIPLCPEHHLGKTGLHGLGTREFERRYKTTELELLSATLERLA